MESTENCRIFVGGLVRKIDDPLLEEIFSEFGKVKESEVIIDKATGYSRGFGFITFTSPDSVPKAISGMNRKELYGREISVKVATKEGTIMNSRRDEYHRRYDPRSSGPGYSRYDGNGPNGYGYGYARDGRDSRDGRGRDGRDGRDYYYERERSPRGYFDKREYFDRSPVRRSEYYGSGGYGGDGYQDRKEHRDGYQGKSEYHGYDDRKGEYREYQDKRIYEPVQSLMPMSSTTMPMQPMQTLPNMPVQSMQNGFEERRRRDEEYGMRSGSGSVEGRENGARFDGPPRY
ncbi:hypothetical protein HK098_001262 [Nowakowskiella sp. JEL0407]|nr:hypothetical protein HK098_001262 [Nowakowskiella sp. JEL0407]